MKKQGKNIYIYHVMRYRVTLNNPILNVVIIQNKHSVTRSIKSPLNKDFESSVKITRIRCIYSWMSSYNRIDCIYMTATDRVWVFGRNDLNFAVLGFRSGPEL